MLYIGFKDSHRADPTDIPKYGQFAERFGNGEAGMGVIEDWTPSKYNHSDVVVPWYLPDTTATRQDISAQYTSISRLDAGISG